MAIRLAAETLSTAAELISDVIRSAKVSVEVFCYAFLLRRFIQEEVDKYVCATAILLAPNTQQARRNGAAATSATINAPVATEMQNS